ncbi:chymotrypsin-2-like [Melitaea cinxia]|uniref:chymotrypsin-2-like n=1 Tax=Melitaea cinxia TaxID=113334 RepID=UPI001E272DBF|nr:chymotrypsin-2-like [Melitaea cinxia]
MSFKSGFLLIALLAGSYAFPAENDMSIFFDHTDSSSRIVGGTTAGRVPYMVALTTGAMVRNLLCGGSLVTSRHVLTAAHCIAGGNFVSSLRGHVNTNRFASGGTSYSFSSRIIHHGYNANTIKNDIGLLVTSSNVALSSSVSLAPVNFNFVGAGVPTTVTGWGRTRSGGSLSQVLLQLSATVVDGNVCRTRVAQRAQEISLRNVPPVNPDVEICTFHSNGRGTCNGDSGSPLMRADRNQQIGVVSWGLPCARNAPDMFVRLSAFRSWFEQNTR